MISAGSWLDLASASASAGFGLLPTKIWIWIRLDLDLDLAGFQRALGFPGCMSMHDFVTFL